MSTRTAVIIGGGVIGLSTAYHLARKQYGKIILLDKGPVGDGSSSRAAGIITDLMWSETGVRARIKSLQLYGELSQDLVGYKFQDVGCLNFFDKASYSDREKLYPIYRKLDVPFEIIDAQEMNRRWPALRVPQEIVGVHDPRGGYSEPDDYIPAITRKIKELGVEVRERQQIQDFVLRGGQVRGVVTSQGTIEADAVVSTVHAWTLSVLGELGLSYPIKTFVHQRYVTKPLPEPIKLPAVNANPLGGYVRPANGNRILVGVETGEREEHRVTAKDWHMSALTVPAGLKEELYERFITLVPALAQTSWETEKVGLIMFSMDGEPILGPVARYPGLFLGTAFHSGGFAYNPVAGMLLAEFVADGKTSIDVSAFSPERFTPEETQAHLAMTLAQKDSIRRRH